MDYSKRTHGTLAHTVLSEAVSAHTAAVRAGEGARASRGLQFRVTTSWPTPPTWRGVAVAAPHSLSAGQSLHTALGPPRLHLGLWLPRLLLQRHHQLGLARLNRVVESAMVTRDSHWAMERWLLRLTDMHHWPDWPRPRGWSGRLQSQSV